MLRNISLPIETSPSTSRGGGDHVRPAVELSARVPGRPKVLKPVSAPSAADRLLHIAYGPPVRHNSGRSSVQRGLTTTLLSCEFSVTSIDLFLTQSALNCSRSAINIPDTTDRKMLPLGLFICPFVIAASGDLIFDDYVTDVETASLPNFLAPESLSNALIVPEFGDGNIVSKLFDSAVGMKILNPADNFLIVLPQSVMSISENLDIPSRTGNESAEKSSETSADLVDLESPEVVENTVESSTVLKLNDSREIIDSSIDKCLEKMYTKLLDNHIRRLHERRIENEEGR